MFTALPSPPLIDMVLVREMPALTAPLVRAVVDAEWAFCSLLPPDSRVMVPLDKGHWCGCLSAGCQTVLLGSSCTRDVPTFIPQVEQAASCTVLETLR